MTRSWQFVYVGVLMLAAVAWWYAPGYGPWIAGAAYVMFILTPQGLLRNMAEARSITEFQAAGRWLPLIKVLHPFRDWQALASISKRQFTVIDEAASQLAAVQSRSLQTRLLENPATYGLIATNLVIFAFTTIMGLRLGEVRAVQIYGAFVPQLALSGAWWRAFTSEFLHFGVAHVAFNMLALNNFGRGLEARLGSWRFLAIYLLSGAMAAGGILVLATQGLQAMNQIYAGASASIFGIVGAQLYLAVSARRTGGAPQGTLDIQSIVWLVLMQSVFDFSVPGISFAGHILGLLSGFVLCAVVSLVWPKRDLAAELPPLVH